MDWQLVGLCVEIVGFVVLSVDLIVAKLGEVHSRQFESSARTAEAASISLIVATHRSFRQLMTVLAGVAMLDAGKDDLDEQLQGELRKATATAIADAEAHLMSESQIDDALKAITALRVDLESRMNRQVRMVKRMRLMAIVGVVLAGLGTLMQLIGQM